MSEASSAGAAKDRYNLAYQTQLDLQAEWLRRGATDKVDSIQYPLENSKIVPDTVLELGAGTGGVVQERERRGIGRNFLAVDYAEEAISYLQSHATGIETRVFDITAPDFSLEGHFDLMILSHVLEHLEQPQPFLQAALKRIDYSHLVIEVPLENLLGLRLKAIGKDRTVNRANHVQFFTLDSFASLVRSCGLRITDQRVYVPVVDRDMVRFVCAKNGESGPGLVIKLLTQHYLPRVLTPMWKRWYYAHCAVLCESQSESLIVRGE